MNLGGLRGAALGVLALVSGGCATDVVTIEPIRHATGMADAQVAARYIRTPHPGHFSVCHEHTCHAISEVSLTAAEWDGVRRIFAPPAPDAAAERGRIALAIAALEQLVGAYTGTANDQGLNFPGLGLSGQMDCVDESTNTSAYLLMFQQDGLLHRHRVGARISRGFLQLETLHFTTTVVENGTGTSYAVDSWFHDNGKLPEVVPVSEWIEGWKPSVQSAAPANASGRH